MKRLWKHCECREWLRRMVLMFLESLASWQKTRCMKHWRWIRCLIILWLIYFVSLNCWFFIDQELILLLWLCWHCSQKPKAPLFHIGSGWNFTGLFFKWIHINSIAKCLYNCLQFQSMNKKKIVNSISTQNYNAYRASLINLLHFRSITVVNIPDSAVLSLPCDEYPLLWLHCIFGHFLPTTAVITTGFPWSTGLQVSSPARRPIPRVSKWFINATIGWKVQDKLTNSQ